jgi:CBS domain-containing protein
MGFGQKASQEFLKSVPVKEVMTDELVTVEPSQEVKAAARLMIDRKIGCLPVVDGGKLVGLLTETDFVKLVLAE